MYDYKSQREKLFTEDGQVTFLEIRDRVKMLIGLAGCVRMDKAIATASGDTWTMLACVDRLVELREIKEITPLDTVGQYRIFITC